MQHEHGGHRGRLKARFLAEGLDNFAEHEILELLLFHSIPQRNTNDIAHELINRFGSLEGVLEADPDSLKEVDYIKDNSVVIIKLVAAIARRYAIASEKDEVYFDTVEKIGRYLRGLYLTIPCERVYMMMFDNSMRLIECAHIVDGAVNCASITTRVMLEKALRKNASNVVVAHNHPNGLAIPSNEDIEISRVLDQAFDLVGVNMLEHIVVAGNKFTPIMRSQKGVLRASPITKDVDENFYLKFYGDVE